MFDISEGAGETGAQTSTHKFFVAHSRPQEVDMKAAVVRTIGQPFEIEDLQLDDPFPREVVVDVRAVGLCHSDLSFADSDFGTPLPAVLGHEFAGVVAKVGADVRSVAPGDHVVGSMVRACGGCTECLAGRPYQCGRKNELLRRRSDPPRLATRDGSAVTAALGTAAFAEQCLVHENQLVKIPLDMPMPQAALLGCATVTGAGAVLNAAKVTPGDAVAVVGLGGVGLNTLSGAHLSGAYPIIAVDVVDQKLELAKRFGATHTVNASAEDAVEAVRRISNGGVKHAFEVVGSSRTATQAVKMTGTGGVAYFLGMPKLGDELRLDITADLLTHQRSLVGVYMGASNIHVDIPRYAEWYLAGKLNLDDLIDSEISLKEINDGFTHMRSGTAARQIITSWD